MAGDYEVLGISKKATGPEIDAAFRIKAAARNPDLGRAGVSPAEVGRRSKKLREVIEARDTITERRKGLITAILEEIKGIKQEAV